MTTTHSSRWQEATPPALHRDEQLSANEPQPGTHKRWKDRALRRVLHLPRTLRAAPGAVTLPLLAAALASVLLPASSGASATSSTPFTADVAGHASFAPTPEQGVVAVTTSGAGHASHLGQVTLSSTETLDFATTPGTTVVRDGMAIVAAANGDELHLTYGGTGSPPDTGGSSSLSGTFLITGGTGRFFHAGGNGLIEGSANAVTGSLHLSYRGTIIATSTEAARR